MICFNRQQHPEILLVQQNPVEVGVTLREFSKWSEKHRVTSVPDTDTAEIFLAQQGIYRRAPRPDMVIIDQDLPGNGVETLLKLLHTSESLKGVPTVLMGSRGDRKRGRAFDVFEIDKPLRLDALLRLARSRGLPWHQRQSRTESPISSRDTRVDNRHKLLQTPGLVLAGAQAG